MSVNGRTSSSMGMKRHKTGFTSRITIKYYFADSRIRNRETGLSGTLTFVTATEDRFELSGYTQFLNLSFYISLFTALFIGRILNHTLFQQCNTYPIYDRIYVIIIVLFFFATKNYLWNYRYNLITFKNQVTFDSKASMFIRTINLS